MKEKGVPPGRLLIIDDDSAMGSFVRAVAEPLGYVVETYTEAKAFKAAVAQADPDVIILDITMPDTDGIELLLEFSKRQVRAKIFIMSGFDQTIRQAAFDLGKLGNLSMGSIIPKPVRAAHLRALLARP